MPEDLLLHQTDYLALRRLGHWDYVTRRPKATGVVAVLALSAENELVLVEQFRLPVQNRVIEICAGLVGDEEEFQGEELAETARRELLEETGYHAGTITHLLSSPTSPGMTDEITHFYLATELTRQHEGGGVAGEEIIVHHVALTDFPDFIKQQQERGLLIDAKIHAALQLAEAHLP
ncbi:MAG: NUDIX hydrolase [Verrucomicrobiales bacterium]